MDRVQGVSLPRCGHNLLVQHLQQYFGSDAVCPDYRKQLVPFLAKAKRKRQTEELGDPHKFHYCEYYYSCRTHPCCDANNTFQKSHDFELDLPIGPKQKYIVQTRNHLGLLISWFKLRLPRKREVDTADGFIAFMRRNQDYLADFQAKWIDSAIDHRLVLDYDDYLQRPAELLTRAIGFFEGQQELDLSKIKKIVSDVRPAKDNREFRFYDAVKSIGEFIAAA